MLSMCLSVCWSFQHVCVCVLVGVGVCVLVGVCVCVLVGASVCIVYCILYIGQAVKAEDSGLRDPGFNSSKVQFFAAPYA